jgi:protein-S-isoprenylcysteine O-methyltransferase Ste14
MKRGRHARGEVCMIVSKLFMILFWAWTASEALLQFAMRTRSRAGVSKDRGSLILLLLVIFLSVWGALSYRPTPGQMLPGDPKTFGLAALALMSAGMAVRAYAILTLGNAFSTNVAIRATQRLKTNGLYRWLRHPSYTGMLLIFAAIGVAARNWVSLAIMLAFPTAALLYRIHVEERALSEAFGAEYSIYSKATKRLVPGIY